MPSAEEPPSAPSSDTESLVQSVASPDWRYVDADTQRWTHGIHRYSGKFIPQIAARAIETLSRPGELVVDPYCGSGTTIVEAVRLGRRATGIDLNPLAVLIARVKTTPLKEGSLSAAMQSLSAVVDAWEREPHDISSMRCRMLEEVEADPRLRDPVFTKWFQPQVLRDLIALRHGIERLAEAAVQDAALVAFSEVLRRSSNAHSGYPNVMFDKKTPPRNRPGRPFLRVLERTFAAISTLSSPGVDWADGKILSGDAQALPLGDASVDAIVSHPPYIGSVPYAEYGMLSLLWLGADHKALDGALTGGRRQRKDVVDRFRQGYAGMLAESYRVLRPGRRAFVMVGNPTVRGETIDLAEMTRSLASAVGFEVEAETRRDSVNRRANKMGAEHLLFLRK